MSNWFCPALLLPLDVRAAISEWSSTQEWPLGTTIKRPNRLHTTLMYSPDHKGEGEQIMENEIDIRNWDFDAWTSRVSAFTPGEPKRGTPVVIELHSFWLTEYWNRERIDAIADTYKIEAPSYGSYQPHITVAELPPGAEFEWMMPPHLEFKFQSIPVELRTYYNSLQK